MASTHMITLPAPTDTIVIDNDSAELLYSLWCGSGSNRSPSYMPPSGNIIKNVYFPVVPTDLMIAETIPLPHFALSHLGRFFKLGDGDTIELEAEEFKINTLLPEESHGEYEVHATSRDISFVYIVKNTGRWESFIVPQSERGYLWYEGSLDMRKFLELERTILLADWYAIQLALLNPSLELIFSDPSREKIYTREGKGKERKRVVRYVRRHYITSEKVNDALYGKDHKALKRKTLAWYVAGHWRQYKNGKRKFIKGYWKGPLRELKRNLDRGRIREVTT